MATILSLAMRSQRNHTILLILLLYLCGPAAGRAEEYAYDPTAYAEWLKTLKSRALREGIGEKTVREALADVKPIARIVELDRKQPESTFTFAEYKQRVLPESRIKKARKLYAQHKSLLEKIGKKYGVQPRFIAALWGIESSFGENMGSYYVPEALATLAFEGRRREFFTRELLDALRILDQGHVTRENMKGSWAGAMGQSQFMPSSFLRYAVDYDGDGRRDIWKTQGDVFASIARYLSESGWDRSATWGRKVRLPRGFDYALAGREVEKDLAEWRKLGVKTMQGGNLPRRKLQASIVLPDGKDGEAYLVYGNYKTVLKWNKSLYFATAVGEFSDATEK